MKNPCRKTREVDNPYEVYRSDLLPHWEWRVLQKYEAPDKEAKNEYAIWFCAVKSPNTYGQWELGDVYVKDILEVAKCYKVEKKVYIENKKLVTKFPRLEEYD